MPRGIYERKKLAVCEGSNKAAASLLRSAEAEWMRDIRAGRIKKLDLGQIVSLYSLRMLELPAPPVRVKSQKPQKKTTVKKKSFKSIKKSANTGDK